MIRAKRYLLKLPNREIQLGDRTLIMGIINVTPDSFSDGGQYMDPDMAAERAMELENLGADIIDIGAESTRPGSPRVAEAEELRRLIPVLKKLKGKLGIPISVDTVKSAVAAKALENGAEFINDPSGLTLDAELAKAVADAGAGLILNHMRGTPETWAKLGTLAHPMKAVMEDLEAAVNRARRAGVERGRIIIDPGLGFGKRGEQNFELLARLGEMHALDLPVLVGPSRKSFLGYKEVEDADLATTAAVTVAVTNGAHIVRVHNVAAMRPVLQTVDGIAHSVTPDGDAKPRKAAIAPKNVEFGEKPAVVSPSSRPIRPVIAAKATPSEGGERPPRRFEGERPYGDRPPRRFDEDRPRRSFDSSDGPPRKYGAGRPSGDGPPRRRFDNDRPEGDRPRRSFGTDRPPRKYGDKPEGDRPPRKYGAGRPSSDGPPRRRFDNDRPGGDRPQRSFGADRPPRKYGDKPEGDRPPRKYGADRPSGDGPPRRRFDNDRPGGDRPQRSFGTDRPPRKYGDKPEGDRPPRKFAGKPGGYKKPGFGAGKSFGGPKRDFKGGKPAGRKPGPRRDS